MKSQSPFLTLTLWGQKRDHINARWFSCVKYMWIQLLNYWIFILNSIAERDLLSVWHPHASQTLTFPDLSWGRRGWRVQPSSSSSSALQEPGPRSPGLACEPLLCSQSHKRPSRPRGQARHSGTPLLLQLAGQGQARQPGLLCRTTPWGLLAITHPMDPHSSAALPLQGSGCTADLEFVFCSLFPC